MQSNLTDSVIVQCVNPAYRHRGLVGGLVGAVPRDLG